MVTLIIVNLFNYYNLIILRKRSRFLKIEANFQHKNGLKVEKTAVCGKFIVKLHKEQKNAKSRSVNAAKQKEDAAKSSVLLSEIKLYLNN